jgi:hypothetical protein
MADLIEIVVFRGHPKHRHRGNSAARQFLRDLHGRQGFLNGIRRPAEQPYLLSRNDSDSAFLKPVQVGQRFRSRPEVDVLFAKSGSDFCSAVGWIVHLTSRARRRLHGRRMKVERLHLIKVIQIFQKKLRLMGKLAEREDATIHEPLDDARGKTSHQLSLIVPN